MRAIRIGAAVAALVLALVSTAPAAAGSPFAGTWVSIDADGSQQALIVGGGPSPRVTYQDFYASSCAGEGSPTTHWVSAGTGSIEGDVLVADFPNGGCGPFKIGGHTIVFTYDAATDTLTDSFGITWSRFA